MTETTQITLSFLERHPHSAAAELTALDAGTATEFVSAVPARIAAGVIAQMAPWSAARLMEGQSEASAAAILRAMVLSDAVPVLRLLGGERRDAILEQLPKRAAAAFRNSLDYPMWSVGAWTDHRVITLAESDSIESAIDAFRQQKENAGSWCCVVDAAGRFSGIADLSRLLPADPHAPLGNIVEKRITALAARAPLTATVQLGDWNRWSALPVLGRKRNPIGRLPRAALAKASAQDQGSGTAEDSDIFSALIGGYLDIGPALIEAALPPERKRKVHGPRSTSQ